MGNPNRRDQLTAGNKDPSGESRLPRRSQARGAARREGPREVVAADGAERVEDLAAQMETWMEPAFERAGIDLVEGDAAPGDLGALASLVAGPIERMTCQRFHHPAAIFTTQLRKT